MISEDTELLCRYLDAGAEDAFAALVRRHIGHVHGTALRRVGYDAQLAEDVTQKVFTDLARKAPLLRHHAALGGWLHVAAHVTAAAVVRAEQRRKTREAATDVMSAPSIPVAGDDAAAFQPALDEALVALKAPEREAIVLRFFQRRSFAEVGTALRVSEEAARKRVDRALEKLRRILARRGITSSTIALGAALGVAATVAVPALLATRVSSVALAGAAAGGGATAVSLLAGLQAAWPVAVVVTAAASLWMVQQGRQRGLTEELAELREGARDVAAVRAENRRLAGALAAADELRRAGAKVEGMRRAVAARPAADREETAGGIKGALTVRANGTLVWEGESVSLRDFVRRLETLRAGGGASGSMITIAAPGVSFSALAYVVDETRKAGIERVVVTSDAKPDPKVGFTWF